MSRRTPAQHKEQRTRTPFKPRAVESATKSLPGLALVKGELPAGIGNWFHIHTSSKSCTPCALSAASLQMHHRDSQ